MNILSNKSVYKGMFFSFIPYPHMRIPADISFVILPLSMYFIGKKSLIKLLKILRTKNLYAGLWINVPKNIRQKAKVICIINELKRELLTFPIIIKADTDSMKGNRWINFTDEISNLGFYPILWTEDKLKVHRMDLCSNIINPLNEVGGIFMESKKQRIKGTFNSCYLMYTNWDYGAYIEYMGWNVNIGV